MAKTFKQRLAEEVQKQAVNAGNQQLPANNDLSLLPAETQKEIHAFAAEQTKDLDTKDTHGMGFYCGAVAGITIGAASYATKLHQMEQDYDKLREEFTLRMNNIAELEAEIKDLRRWKMEAAEVLTKIHSYAHKHLEIKLGQSIVDFVINQAKERDELKEKGQKMADAMEWIQTYGPGDQTTVNFITKALNAWNGNPKKEGEDE
jgi:hypothetical protein